MNIPVSLQKNVVPVLNSIALTVIDIEPGGGTTGHEIATIGVLALDQLGNNWNGTLVFVLSTNPGVSQGTISITNGRGQFQRIGVVGVRQTLIVSQTVGSTPNKSVTINF